MGINGLQKSELCAMDIMIDMALRLGRFFPVRKVILWLMLIFCTRSNDT